MNTYNTFHTLLSQDIRELQQLQKRGWRVLPMTRTVKEEHLGRCCYLAEEFLSTDELRILKQKVGLDDHQWRTYKAKISG